MTPRTKTTSRILALAAVALAGGLLSGCGGASGQPAADAPAAGSGGTVSETEATPAATAGVDGFPTCDEVKAAIGSVVEELIELEGTENGVSTGADGPSLTCAWHTKETNSENINIEEYGGISVGVSRDPEYTEESMGSLGWNVDDPRVSAAGAWAVKVGGGYDPADQLDVAGVQVVREGIVVVLTSGGVALQDVPQLASATNEWALGAGVSVLGLMD